MSLLSSPSPPPRPLAPASPAGGGGDTPHLTSVRPSRVRADALSAADGELVTLCAELETALAPRPRKGAAGANTAASPPRFALERSVRLALPSAGIPLSAEQSVRVRRACSECDDLPSLLRAVAAVAQIPAPEIARRILRRRDRDRPRTATPEKRAAAAARAGTAMSPNKRASPPPPLRASASQSPRSPRSPRSPAPRSPVLLSVPRFTVAFDARSVRACVAAHAALWRDVFARHAAADVWSADVFADVMHRAGLHKGPLSKVMRARVEVLAAKGGWGCDAALKGVAFVALHRSRNSPQRLAASELPPVLEGALRGAFAALAVVDVGDGGTRANGSAGDAPSTPSTPSTVGIPVRDAEARKLFHTDDADDTPEGEDEEEDDAFAAMVNIPLRASIGHVLENSADKEREREMARDKERAKAKAFAEALSGKDDMAELKEEIGRLRDAVVGMDQRQQREWGVRSVCAAVAASAGVAITVVVAAGAADAAGLLGGALPFVEQKFSVLI